MARYQNLGGPGIRAYEIEADSMTIQFSDGSVYVYTYQSAGRENIEQMKALALAGQGLDNFIKRRARNAYAAKLR
jgi:hypothetical protein